MATALEGAPKLLAASTRPEAGVAVQVLAPVSTRGPVPAVVSRLAPNGTMLDDTSRSAPPGVLAAATSGVVGICRLTAAGLMVAVVGLAVVVIVGAVPLPEKE